MLREDVDGFINDCLRQLAEPDPVRRLEAVACLGRLQRKGRPAVPALCARLENDDSAHVRKMIALALGDIGALEAVPALRNALNDPSEAVRRRAAIALEEIGADPTRAA
jgi:HEAT repeat protein